MLKFFFYMVDKICCEFIQVYKHRPCKLMNFQVLKPCKLCPITIIHKTHIHQPFCVLTELCCFFIIKNRALSVSLKILFLNAFRAPPSPLIAEAVIIMFLGRPMLVRNMLTGGVHDRLSQVAREACPIRCALAYTHIPVDLASRRPART